MPAVEATACRGVHPHRLPHIITTEIESALTIPSFTKDRAARDKLRRAPQASFIFTGMKKCAMCLIPVEAESHVSQANPGGIGWAGTRRGQRQ
jgi:hypothetical protein